MKIVHISDRYCEMGGAEKYLLDTCNALEEMGHQIVIISGSEGKHISISGRREYFLPSSFGIRSALRVWPLYKDILEKEDPDVVQLHNTHYFISPFLIKRIHEQKPTVKFVHDARLFCPHLGKKIVPAANDICRKPVGLHCFNRSGCYPFHEGRNGIADNIHKFLFVRQEIRVSRSLERMIVGSRYMCDELVRNGFDPARITVNPCYTDKNPECRIYDPVRRVILCVGRFDGVKGIPQFIDALDRIRDAEWNAEIVGDGPLRTDAEQKVQQLGLSGRIAFLGQLSAADVDRRYQQCSMVVVPSMIPESFGLVGIEAMAFGRPVVAFDSGGIREWLVDGETGYLVRRSAVDAFASSIRKLLQDDLAQNMGARGMERVKRYFRKDQHIKRLETLYEEAKLR